MEYPTASIDNHTYKKKNYLDRKLIDFDFRRQYSVIPGQQSTLVVPILFYSYLQTESIKCTCGLMVLF